MAQIKAGHLVAKYLREVENITTVFGISGGHIEAMLDGFTEYNIRTVDVRHEQAAAMMAHAYSVYTGKPGVCFLTAGPGFTNGLTASQTRSWTTRRSWCSAAAIRSGTTCAGRFRR
jgi:acetolactate synthase-1/2/3 large subunit